MKVDTPKTRNLENVHSKSPDPKRWTDYENLWITSLMKPLELSDQSACGTLEIHTKEYHYG